MKYLSAFWKENRKFMLLLATIVFFKSAIADLNSISGRSMQPTLLDGDKVWVNKLAYDVKIGRRGAIAGYIGQCRRSGCRRPRRRPPCPSRRTRGPRARPER